MTPDLKAASKAADDATVDIDRATEHGANPFELTKLHDRARELHSNALKHAKDSMQISMDRREPFRDAADLAHHHKKMSSDHWHKTYATSQGVSSDYDPVSYNAGIPRNSSINAFKFSKADGDNNKRANAAHGLAARHHALMAHSLIYGKDNIDPIYRKTGMSHAEKQQRIHHHLRMMDKHNLRATGNQQSTKVPSSSSVSRESNEGMNMKLKNIIKEWKELIEIGGFPITKVPSNQLKATNDTFGSDQSKNPSILTRALQKKARTFNSMGVPDIQKGAHLLQKKSMPVPPSPNETQSALADLPRPKKPQSDVQQALADLPRRKPLPMR